RRRRRALGSGRRPAATAADLAGGRALARGREGARQAPDRVRLRRDRGAAAGRGRRLGCDQRPALPGAEGDHGREEEAAGDALARRHRRPGRGGGRGWLAYDGRSAERPAVPGRHPEDRRRRLGRREDRRVPGGEEGCMKFLVFLEHHEGKLQKDSLGVVGKAAALGEAEAVLLGSELEGLAADAGRFGAQRVYVMDDVLLAKPLPQPRVDALETLVSEGGFDAVLFGASVLSADVAAGLAARLDAGLNYDLTDLAVEGGELVGKRPALGDSVYVDVGWRSEPRLALVRSGTFEPQESGGSAEVEKLESRLQDFSLAATMVEQAHEESEGPSIEDADVIVAGGRGLGGPEGFAAVEELAKALGGAVAATRAVVDAGWYPYSAQVGQTGKTVSPKL